MLKLVKGATKPKAAAPKAKYIEPILATTYEEGKDFATTMEALGRVLAKTPAWTSQYKALIVLHIMIREGSEEVTLKYLSKHPRMLEPDEATARQAVGLLRYCRYISVRAAQFRETKVDYVRYKTRQGHGRLYGLTVDKGLLRESESVIVQLEALLKCHFEEQDVDNDVVLMVFRLLSHDLLSLFQVLNEGVINLLEHYFELSKVDAETALDVYRGFTRLTNKVISFLRVAKNLEYQTKFHVPNIKHAPTSLVSSLEMYLNDPDFETNRRQYLAEKSAKPRRDREDRSELAQQPTANQRELSAKVQGDESSQPPAMQQRQPSFKLSNQMQQPQTIQFAQPAQPVQSQQPQPVQAAPARSSFDLLDFGQATSAPAAAPAAAPVPAQPSPYNPFYAQVQQEVLAQTQAAQIQLEQSQAQMQMQQMQYQQQQLQQSQLLQAQLTGGWDLGQVPSHQQQQPFANQQVAQHTQPMQSQSSILPVQTTGYNPFKRVSMSTNPFAQDQVNPQQSHFVPQMASQMAQQVTGTNPFRNSIQ